MTERTGGPDGGTDVLPGSRSALDPARAIKPGRHGLSPETVAGIQRGRLIDALVEVVSARGYPQTTISGVAGAAGVTKKTFYEHFDGLDACFLAAYRRGMDILHRRMADAYEAAPSWPDGVHAALRTMLALLAREPRFARAALIEANAAGPDVRLARLDDLARFRAFFAAPGLPPVPDAVADAVVGGVVSAVRIRIETGDDDLQALLPSLTYFAVLPLLGPEAATPYLSPTRP
ncbi:TetR/AcrR family transcriptional regulator [Spirillospora sp. NPDC052242]